MELDEPGSSRLTLQPRVGREPAPGLAGDSYDERSGPVVVGIPTLEDGGADEARGPDETQHRGRNRSVVASHGGRRGEGGDGVDPVAPE